MQNSSTGENLGNSAKSATSDSASGKSSFRFTVPATLIPKTLNNPSSASPSSQLFPSSLPPPSFPTVTSPFGINTPTSAKPLGVFQNQPFIQNPASTFVRPGIQKSGLPSSRDQVPSVFGSQFFRPSTLDASKQVPSTPILPLGDNQKMQQASVDELPTSSQETLSTLPQQTEAATSKLKNSVLASDISQLRAIVVYKIPEDSNNKLELTKHFQRFGNVIRIITNTKKGNAAIYFDSHDAAAKAKEFGTKLRPNVEFKILWKQVSQKEKKVTAIKPSPVGAGISSERVSSDQNRTIQTTDMADSTTKQNLPKRSGHSSAFNLSEGIPLQITMDELRGILSQPANSVGDKATLLDARDRFLRLKKANKSKTTSSLSKSTTLLGTCLDMCPEKERYSRAEKRRLAPYELLDTQEYEVDHRLAVKEYSRSSADQAEPLAHELRPLPVLKMTTDYLIVKIIDRCDKPGENLAEWFNFLWDRTRGIRKDITQQSLCEPGSVDLVEKCARFHVHCTARLCELSMQDFDQKINDENLTKCLQTLKHMYYDLSVKGIHCPCEAEFRAYDVLLHLNDGEILKQVLQLRPEVRDSEQVRTALLFVSALNSRNYVRFFKLAERNRNYLQCCLLQRYFNQMRNQALQVMVQAYGPPKKGQIQLASLVNLLGFEGPEEAAVWCESHGLPVDMSKAIVNFERSNFIELPEKFPSLRRSFRLIESKRMCSVGHIISNGPIPEDPTPKHLPHNSFDSSGILLREAWLTEGLGESIQAPTVPSVPAPIVQIPSRTVSPSVVKFMSDRILKDVIDVAVNDAVSIVASDFLRQTRIFKTCHSIGENILNQLTRDMCFEAVSEFVALKKHQEQKKLDDERKIQLFSSKIFDQVVDSVLKDETERLTRDEMRVVAERIRAKQLTENVSLRIFTSLLENAVVSESHENASVTAREATEMRERLVMGVKAVVGRLRLVRWINQWRRFCARRIRLRVEKETFPACSSRLPLGQQVASLKSKGETTVLQLKRKSIVDQSASAKRLNYLSDVQSNITSMGVSLEGKVLDLFSLVEEPLLRHLHKNKTCSWKLLISAVNCEGFGDILKQWFGFHSAKPSPSGWIHVETRVAQRPLTVCVRFENGCQNILEALHGANAILVIYNPLTTGVEVTLRNVAYTVMKYRENNPVAVASIATASSTLIMHQHLSATLQPCFHVVLDILNSPPEKHLKLSEAVLALVEATVLEETTIRQGPESLSTCTLWELANNFISSKILPTIYSNLRERLRCGVNHQAFDILLSFFNSGIQHLMDNVITDYNLRHLKWPAKELAQFHDLVSSPLPWNSSAYQEKLRNALGQFLILPDLPDTALHFSSTCVTLRNYCTSLSVIEKDTVSLVSRVDTIVNNWISQYTNLDDSASQTESLPWTDIFQACVDFRLQAFLPEGSSMIVGYSAEALSSFQMNEYWIKACNWRTNSDGVTMEPELTNRKVKDSSDLSKSINLRAIYMTDGCQNHLPQVLSNLCDAITETSKQSRQENERFESLLQSAITQEHLMVPRRPMKEIPASQQIDPALPVNMGERLQVLNGRLDNSRREDSKFESYLKNALQDF